MLAQVLILRAPQARSQEPPDYYTRSEAERAIADAEVIVEWSRGMLPG